MKKTVSLFNTRGRKKENFSPVKDGVVGLYTCGPTVYHYAHIGNMRTFVFEDLLKRTLKHAGYNVKHVMNITDVGHLVSDGDEGEDKLIVGAQREQKSVWDIAKYYTDVFQSDLKKLNIIEPDVWTKATDYIAQQIELVKQLEEKGFTYKTDDGIYFDTSKYEAYGKWANLDFSGIKAGARIDMADKKNPSDFALWKFSPQNEKREMEWESPWGLGFPGWHIECSAMALDQLEEHLDIHCGGIDLIPTHHTNEIAQSECATGKQFFKFWMHGEFIVFEGGEKMSKSKGDIITLSSLQDMHFEPLAFRYLCLNTHYRKPLMFSYKALESATNGYASLVHLIDLTLKEQGVDESTIDIDIQPLFLKAQELSDEALFDDLDIPRVLGHIFSLLKEIRLQEQSISDYLKNEIKSWIFKIDTEILGLELEKRIAQQRDIPAEVWQQVKEREQYRAESAFEKADTIRDKLQASGYLVMDTEFGPVVRKEIQ